MSSVLAPCQLYVFNGPVSHPSRGTREARGIERVTDACCRWRTLFRNNFREDKRKDDVAREDSENPFLQMLNGATAILQ